MVHFLGSVQQGFFIHLQGRPNISSKILGSVQRGFFIHLQRPIYRQKFLRVQLRTLLNEKNSKFEKSKFRKIKS